VADLYKICYAPQTHFDHALRRNYWRIFQKIVQREFLSFLRFFFNDFAQQILHKVLIFLNYKDFVVRVKHFHVFILVKVYIG